MDNHNLDKLMEIHGPVVNKTCNEIANKLLSQFNVPMTPITPITVPTIPIIPITVPTISLENLNVVNPPIENIVGGYSYYSLLNYNILHKYKYEFIKQ